MNEQQHKTTQVIIVGAGPTGLHMAVQLLRYGIDFVIIDKNERTTHLSKALAVQARTLEIFDETGLAIRAVDAGQIIEQINLLINGKIRALVNMANLGKGLSPFPYVLILEQSKTEKLLIDYLHEHGKAVEWQSEFTHMEEAAEAVTVFYKNANGHEQKITASYVIGCDGAHSNVRHELGFTFEGDTVPKLFYVADVKLRSTAINNKRLAVYQIRKGFILFFPMEGEGHYRIIGVLPDAQTEDFTFADVEAPIKQAVSASIEFEEVFWFSTYKVHSRMANSFGNNRCFIAGDAAHIHTPAGGQGMNTGIQDAYNLAWKLAYVLRQQAKPALLETYSYERMNNAKHLLQTTDRMFDLFSGANWFLNFIRLTLFPLLAGILFRSGLIRKRLFPLVSQTSIAYVGSTLTVESKLGKAKAGVRMPHFVFSDGTKIFDYLKEPKFKLLLFGNRNEDVIANINKHVPDCLTRVFKEIPASFFGSNNDFFVLLRPDNHIIYVGKDHSKCTRALQQLFSVQ